MWISGLSFRGGKRQARWQRQCRLFPRLGFPLWNPLSEAPPLQGTPKGGNPSFSTAEIEIGGASSWGKGADHCVVCPSGHGFELFIFTLAAGKSGRGLPLVAVWPVGPRPGGDDREGRLWISGPVKDPGLKAKGPVIFPPPAHASKPPTFRNTPADLPPHPPPRGSHESQ